MEDQMEMEQLAEIRKLINKEELEKEVDDLKNHPLFTDNKEVLNNSSDPNIEALRSIIYDETNPEDTAQSLYK
jgi:hypothetical protein